MMRIQAILLDISGVLYDGKRPIPGALAAFNRLRASGLPMRLLTNTATQRHDQILARLAGMGFQVTPEQLITAPSAALRYVQDQGLRPYCLLHPALKDEFAGLDQRNPNAVILGDARAGLGYEALNQAFRLCREGAPLIGIGMNRYFSENGELWLDAGMYIRGIAWAARCEPLIMGKPSAAFFAQVVQSLDVPAAQCLMIGDDHEADVQGALDAGLQAALVRTGKYRPGDERNLPADTPILNAITELPEWLQSCA
jgi:HAD superfamily hydrolase (TIGR01458 family)